MKNLDEAFDLYGQLAEYEREGIDDLAQAVTDVSSQSFKLAQRHSDLWELFKTVRNKQDEESYEQLLAAEDLRDRFYERLSAFARTLAVVLSSSNFLDMTPEERVSEYKTDLRFFMRLRNSVRRRYAEVVDFKEYEPRVQKLIDQHVGTGEVERITELVNIFDTDAFASEVEKLESSASKADTIAFRTKLTIHDRMQEDPAFYRRFSELLEDAIRAFRECRLSDAEYLRRVSTIAERLRNRTGDDVPEKLAHRDVAKAFFGVLRQAFASRNHAGDLLAISVTASLAVDDIVRAQRIVNWTRNTDVQNRMKGAMEDYLFDLMEREEFELSFEDIDQILESLLDVARVRYA